MPLNHNSPTTSIRCNKISKVQRDAIWDLHRKMGGTINNTSELIQWWINECTPVILNDAQMVGVLLFKIPQS
jgi:hypothetical protein